MTWFNFNHLSTNFTKWLNTLKQFVGNLPTNCLSLFDHFVGLALKGLTLEGESYIFLLLIKSKFKTYKWIYHISQSWYTCHFPLLKAFYEFYFDIVCFICFCSWFEYLIKNYCRHVLKKIFCNYFQINFCFQFCFAFD